MKKLGFTLAEVLITLTIVGIVAAITLPSLTANTANAQLGPKLAKAVSMFEQANEALLNEYSVDALTDAGVLSSADGYMDLLSNYLKVTKVSGGTWVASDGVEYQVTLKSNPGSVSGAAHKHRVGDVMVDINGTTGKPNQAGEDLFYFSMWDDGSLRAKGAKGWDTGSSSDTTWETTCKEGKAPTDATYCAGHIFEHNLKVRYK